MPQLKAMAGAPNMFPSFWDAFEKFVAKQTPPPAAEPEAAQPAETTKPETAETTVIPSQTQGTMFNGEGETDPFAGPGDQDPDFLKRREALWNLIVEKMIPLEFLKEVGISEPTSITAENLTEVEELVQGYQPPKKGKK